MDANIQRIQEQMQQYLNLVQSGAPAAQVAQAESRLRDLVGADNFNMMKHLPEFMKQAEQSVAATQVYQQFRLPGRDYMVQDRRERPQGEPADAQPARERVEVEEQSKEAREGKEGKENKAAKEHRAAGAMEMRVKEGKLTPDRKAGYENYLSDPASRAAADQPRPAAQEPRDTRLFSAFEQLILARFERGQHVANQSKDGGAHFLQKTADQWKQFFSAFQDRIVARKALLSEVREFLFRGMVARGEKAVMISDVVLKNGSVEKFIRFGVIAQALDRLKGLLPGQKFGPDQLAGLTSEELVYLALAVARGSDFAAAQQPSQGLFQDGAMEARVAEHLGIRQGAQGAQSRGKKRGVGLGGFGFLERDERESFEEQQRFIPWWRWGELRQAGRWNWTRTAFYLALLVIGLLGIGVLTARLLGF